jgi:hypothetical protein
MKKAAGMMLDEFITLKNENAKLATENVKLRELSSIMLKCIKANERKALICWECPMHKQFDELRSYCCLEHEAKELGIEIGQ